VADLTLREVAARAGVSPATVKRWLAEGLIPLYDGGWSPAAAAHVRMVARMRERGHSLEEIRRAAQSGQFAPAFIEDLLPSGAPSFDLRAAARATGLSAETIERITSALGIGGLSSDALSAGDVEMLKYYSALLRAGMPLEAILQLARVYGQAFAQIADAEVRLVHIYVHEPLMREQVPAAKIAEQMEGMAAATLPLAAPIMDYLHGRYLRHFIEEDLIGHMEGQLRRGSPELGRMRVALAFADLAGYTRLTEERGEQAAVRAVERFVEAVQRTLPVGARIIKHLGDGVMVVGADPVALCGWAVDFLSQVPASVPPPRIGVHCGEVLYRDGDYFGRDVNQAARVVARAGAGEVLVTRAVVDAARGSAGIRFHPLGAVGLKGFSEPAELFRASIAEP
jgi:adenylate cyclase